MLEILKSTETCGIIDFSSVPEEKNCVLGYDLYDKRAMEYLSSAVTGYLDTPVGMLNGTVLEVKTHNVLDIAEFKESLTNREIYLYDVKFYANSPNYGARSMTVGGGATELNKTPTISTDRGYWAIRYAEVDIAPITDKDEKETYITSDIDAWLTSLPRRSPAYNVNASEYVAHKLNCVGYALNCTVLLNGEEWTTTNRAHTNLDSLITGFGEAEVYLHSVEYVQWGPSYRNVCPVTGDISYPDTLIIPASSWNIRYISKQTRGCRVVARESLKAA